MKVTTFFICLLACGSVLSQSVNFLMKKYNQAIDPDNKLDSVSFLRIKKHHKIFSDYYNKSILGYSDCFHHADGREICFDQDGTRQPIGIFSINDGQNNRDLLPILLYQFPLSDSASFELLSESDSVIELKHTLKGGSYHTYTINSLNYRLIKRKSTSIKNGLPFDRFTFFDEYKEFEGVYVPTRIKYSSKLAKATLTIKSVSFEPFGLSVFD